ncbi:hypothetical protein JS756_30595 [Streptomyces actuosus]|uniref:DUF998 domain-containing protein n=1 Tax=Streptomyces actuosus TaxID=1885 RepID=A0ABS2VYZ8_STRAS|nr:hypothetical protein [Streptomyces actuosus]MBN0048378.1 hypothetical protein [Streptomyces actuosus]
MLWNPRYGGLDFGLVYAGAHLPLLGTSVALLQDVISMHMIWSICVPIALVEAFSRDTRRPWLGRLALSTTTLVFVVGSLALAALQYAYNDRFMASTGQWTTGTVLIVVLVVAACLAGHTPRPQAQAAVPGLWWAGCVAFVLTSAYWVSQALLRDRVPDWISALIWLLLAATALVLAIRSSRNRGWGAGHNTAVAIGALLTYVWVGFTHAADMGVPVTVGLVGNVVFGAGVLVLAVSAVRSVRRHRVAELPAARESDGAALAPNDVPS